MAGPRKKRSGSSAIVRPRDLVRDGHSREAVYEMVRAGELTRIGHGLYVQQGGARSVHRSLAELAMAVPGGVICLLSALRFHDLTTQAPSKVWLAIENKAWRPVVAAAGGIQLVYMSGDAFASGIEMHRIENVNVPIFSAAKSVADCFKYRNKIGVDVAVEALRDFLSRNRRGADEVWRYAKIDRVVNVIRPYLEAAT